VWYDRLHDVLGSVVALTNSVRQVVERYDYDPYGTTTIMDAAAVPLALKPIDPAAADGYYHDHDRDGDIDAADYTDLMDCVNNTPYDPMCIYTHDRTGDRRVDIVDVGVYLAYADDQGLAGGTSAPELVHYGRPLRLQFDADGDGRVDMFDWYAMQTCFTKNTTRCNYLFDDNGDGVVNFYDLTDFKQAADGPQGGPGATQWRRKLVASRYGNPFMWTGQRYDATTGQYHFWARTYSPRLGRWMQRDPLEYVDGVSVYEYVSSEPIGWFDPVGQSKTRREQRGQDRANDRAEGAPPGSGGDYVSDGAGRAIAGHWLTGDGKPVSIVDNEHWTIYMEGNEKLRRQLEKELKMILDKFLKDGKDRDVVTRDFKEFKLPNGESMTGWNYLHGAHQFLVTIQMWRVWSPGRGWHVHYRVTFRWVDRIDPNRKYKSDREKSKKAKKWGRFLFGKAPTDYDISIEWTERGTYCGGNGSSWPFSGP
jgi:RHS repeat-associated protein